MNRAQAIARVREKLANDLPSIGTWMQIPSASIAEILGSAGYDWVVIDAEHGHVSNALLPDLCRALELGGTLPLVRVAEATPANCKAALDAGAGGVILPMIRSADELARVVAACRWPPAGRRGVGFSRANLFGQRFETYRSEAQAPLIVAQIENGEALADLEAICRVDGVDATMIGPYDLSASMGLTGEFDAPAYVEALDRYVQIATASPSVPGAHVVAPDPAELRARIAQGFRFVAYSLDAVFLNHAARCPDVATDTPTP